VWYRIVLASRTTTPAADVGRAEYEGGREHRDEPEDGWSDEGFGARRSPYQNLMMKWRRCRRGHPRGEVNDGDQGVEEPVGEEPVVSWWTASAPFMRFPDFQQERPHPHGHAEHREHVKYHETELSKCTQQRQQERSAHCDNRDREHFLHYGVAQL
jgi:hypothetical protein